ncbi:hypothetical protein IAU60_006142 [Kwoniella sp. DSM 27419]
MLDTLWVLPSTLLILLIGLIRKATVHPPSSSHRLTSPLYDPDPSWAFERSGVNVSLWTASLNGLPKSLLNRLNITLARRLKRVYDAAVGFGLLGLVVSTLGAVWATAAVWKEVWAEMALHAAQDPTLRQGVEGVLAGTGPEVVKRALDSSPAALAAGLSLSISAPSPAGASGSASWGTGSLQPLIPGVTIPLNHLPTLVLALVLNQLIHEFGHAISAALDDIRPSRFSINIHAGLPSMMVAFPSTVDTLDPNAKMRLATSGPCHNLLAWFVLWLLASSGAGQIFWRDQSADGRVVQDVQWASPLYNHLAPGDLLIHLDDIPLSSSFPSSDIWSDYLSSDTRGDEGRGWCMDRTAFMGLPPAPCSYDNATDPSLGHGRPSDLVFVSTYGPTRGEERCLSPHPILDIPSTQCPCPDSRWVCVRPRVDEGGSNVLRIGVRRGGRDSDQVISWYGPRSEVLAAVSVGAQGARGWKAGVRWSALFLRYMSAISLSLFLFNLLPLPYTDGTQLLTAFLQWRSVNRPAMSDSSSGDPTAPPATAPMTMQATLSKPSGPSIRFYRDYELDSDDEEAGIGLGASGRSSYSLSREETTSDRAVRTIVQGCSLAVAVGYAAGWAMLLLLRSS